MTRHRYLLGIVPTVFVLALQSSCGGGETKAPAPPLDARAAVDEPSYVVHTALVQDFNKTPSQVFRVQLDLPADAATWTALKSALGKPDPDLKSAYPIIVNLVKGTPAESGRARQVIEAALGPPYEKALANPIKILGDIIPDYVLISIGRDAGTMRIHMDVPVSDPADWTALEADLSASTPNLAAIHSRILKLVNAATVGTPDQHRRAVGLADAALKP